MKTKKKSKSHAVRWAQRIVHSRLDTAYSKWHWTEDARMTLCGQPIRLISEGASLLPETDDYPEVVECKRCLSKLGESGRA